MPAGLRGYSEARTELVSEHPPVFDLCPLQHHRVPARRAAPNAAAEVELCRPRDPFVRAAQPWLQGLPVAVATQLRWSSEFDGKFGIQLMQKGLSPQPCKVGPLLNTVF